MPAYSEQTNPGSFVKTTTIYDVTPESLRGDGLVDNVNTLYGNINELANVLNIKDSGYYIEQEFVCGQRYFPSPLYTIAAPASGKDPIFRQVFRKVVNFGGLPNAGTTNVAHEIDVLAVDGGADYAGFTFTRIYGVASDTTNTDFIPLPYTAGNNGTAVALDVDQTNVSITTTDDKTTFDTCYVVLEYIKE